MSHLITVSTAADLIGCEPCYIRRLCRDGVLSGAKEAAPPYAWKIERQSVLDYLTRPAMPPGTISTEEAAALAGRSEFAMQRFARAGAFQAVKFGNTWQIERRDFERWLSEQTEPEPEPPLNPAIQQAIDEFLNAKEAVVAEATLKTYRENLRAFVAGAGDSWPKTSDDINAWLAAMKRAGLKPVSIHTRWRNVKAWMRWLHKRGKIDHNPTEAAEKPRKAALLPRAPKEATAGALLAHFEQQAQQSGEWIDVRNYALYCVLLDCGLRVNELCHLTPDNVRLEQQEIFLTVTKTGTEAIVYFSEATRAALAGWLKARAALVTDTTGLFISSHNGRWFDFTTAGVRQLLRRTCEALGLAHVTPHKLRHACAIFSIRSGADLIDVQKQLRHASIATTAIYLQADNSGRRERHQNHTPLSRLEASNAR